MMLFQRITALSAAVDSATSDITLYSTLQPNTLEALAEAAGALADAADNVRAARILVEAYEES